MTHPTRTLWIAALVLCTAIAGLSAQRGGPDGLLGAWSGTWEGAGGSGGFAITLEKAADGALGGKVAVTGEPAYDATLKSVAFDGNKMTAKYDFPPDERAEVLLAATFEGQTAKGTWSVREKGTNTEAVSGTWTVTRK
jgi:hypothetical protein